MKITEKQEVVIKRDKTHRKGKSMNEKDFSLPANVTPKL